MNEIQGFRLQGDRPFSQAVDAVDQCLQQSVTAGTQRVLIDLRELTGFANPDIAARVAMVRRWAATTQGRVRVALVCRAELIDRERFGVVLARALAFDADVFECEDDARQWLQQSPALWADRDAGPIRR